MRRNTASECAAREQELAPLKVKLGIDVGYRPVDDDGAQALPCDRLLRRDALWVKA